jgi:di/tricarboxylate transporter
MAALYLVFLILGLTVFALAIFGDFDHDLGQHFDFGHHDVDNYTDSPGLFSVRTISAFLAGFGTSALIAKWVFEWGTLGQVLLGFGTGLLLAAIAFLLMWAFYKQQSNTLTDSDSLAGKSGLITTATGSQHIGEVKVDNKYFSCKEKDSKILQINDVVKVLYAVQGTLVVEKL